MKTTTLIFGIWVSVGVAATLLLPACGGNPTTVNPLPVDAGDAAADAAHDGAPSASDAAPKIEDGGAD